MSGRSGNGAEREAKLDAEKGKRLAIPRAVLDKVKWPPRREEVASLLDDLDLPHEIEDVLLERGLGKKRDEDVVFADVEKLTEQQLAWLLVVVAVSNDFDTWSFGHGCEKLHDAAKRYGVDFRKVRAEAEGGTRKEVIGKLPAVGEGAKKSAVDAKTAARLAVACPQCHAAPGERCENYKGDFCHPHGARKAPTAKAPAKKAAPKRIDSATRSKIAAAQKKRWAEHKRQAEAKKK